MGYELVYNEKTGMWEELDENLTMQMLFDSEEDIELFKEYMKGFAAFRIQKLSERIKELEAKDNKRSI